MVQKKTTRKWIRHAYVLQFDHRRHNADEVIWSVNKKYDFA